ncbi:MAG: transcriptional repressor [Akkermansia sp.]|nr:transcriptional repressor [Akkermansia sp.]
MPKDPTGKEITRRTATAAFMVRKAGVRMTRQRRAVIEVLLQSYDHPTAAQIYERAKEKHPGISLATVYNCIESLAAERLINQLHFDNGPCRFCPNVEPHVHVLDDATHQVIDVHMKEGLTPEDVFELPQGVRIKSMEAYLRGEIPENSTSENIK